MSDDPRWGKRIIAETRLRRYELRVERAIKRVLAKHKAHAYETLRTQHLTAAAPPDSFGIYSFDSDIDDMVVPELGDVLGDISKGVANFLGLPPEMRAQVLGEIDIVSRTQAFADVVRTIQTDIAPRLMDELSIGIGKGEGMEKLGKRIDDVFEIGERNAERIARTETHGAVEATQFTTAGAISEAGVEVTKEWIATLGDGRTRDTHEKADGQIVGIDEPFTVGDSEMMFPGDGSLGADAGEVINCRCSTAFDIPPGVDVDLDMPDFE